MKMVFLKDFPRVIKMSWFYGSRIASSVAILLMLSSLDSALAANSPLSAKTELPRNISLTVNHGDNLSWFRLTSDNPEVGGKFDYYSSTGQGKSGKLSSKNFKFIARKVASVRTAKSNDIRLCERTFISVNAEVNKKPFSSLGCIGSPTATAKKVTELANIMDLML
jgi:hypothetical protein